MKTKKGVIAFFTLPATVLFLLVFGVSMVMLFSTSFTDWSIGSEMHFVGLQNYIDLVRNDPDFAQAFVNTLVWILLQSTVHVAIGVLFALILARHKFYWKFARAAYMIPNIISSAAMGMMFLILFNAQFGPVNKILEAIGLGEQAPNWFMDKSTAFFAVTIIWLPYAATVTLLVLAEIAAIDPSVYEAGKIDGASELQINLRITLPLLRNIIGTCAILGATSMLQKLDILMMTTKGGPVNRTLNLPLYIYQTALTNNDFARANAAGVYLIGLGLVSVFIINRLFRMNEKNQ